MLLSLVAPAVAGTLGGTLTATQTCEYVYDSVAPNTPLVVNVASDGCAVKVGDEVLGAGRGQSLPPQDPAVRLWMGTRDMGSLQALAAGGAATLGAEGDTAEPAHSLSTFNADARVWWATNRPPGEFVVGVLPDGQTVEPLPRHVEEVDEVTVVVMYPAGAPVPTVHGVCGAEPSISRVYGSYEEASGQILLKSGAGVDGTPPVTFQCADKLTISTSVEAFGYSPVSVSIEVPIDDVYRVSWSLLFGFDGGRRVDGLAVQRPVVPETTTAATTGAPVVPGPGVLTGTSTVTGPRGLVALNAHLGVFNPASLHPLSDHPLGAVALTAAVDPTALESGGLVGVSLFPLPMIGVTGGATLFRSDTVTWEGERYAIGDAWTSEFDPVVGREWVPGWFVGVNLSASLLGAAEK